MKSAKTKPKCPPDKEKSDLEVPDGGWGWVVLTGCFFNYFFLGCLPVAYSVILHDVMISMDVTAAEAAWVSSIRIFTGMVLGPAVTSFALTFSFRKAIIIGGIFSFAGTFFSFFAQRIEVLYVTYGFIGGIGFAFVHGPTLYAPMSYFSRRSGRATGALVAGMPFGRMTFTPVLQALLTFYGFRGVLLIASGLVLNICVGGALIQPVKWHMKKVPKKDDVSEPLMKEENAPDEALKIKVEDQTTDENTNIVRVKENGAALETNKKENEESVEKEVEPEHKRKCIPLDLSFFKNPLFYVVCASNTAIVCVNPYVSLFLPAMGLTKGLSPMEAASLLSIIAGAELLGRVFTPWTIDYKLFAPRTVLIICTFFYANSLWGYIFAQSFIAMALLCVFGGFFTGGLMPANILSITKLLGPEKMPAALSLIHFVQSFFTLFMGPFLGFVRDTTGNYNWTFAILSALQFLACAAWIIFEPLIRRNKCCCSSDSTKKESNEESKTPQPV